MAGRGRLARCPGDDRSVRLRLLQKVAERARPVDAGDPAIPDYVGKAWQAAPDGALAHADEEGEVLHGDEFLLLNPLESFADRVHVRGVEWVAGARAGPDVRAMAAGIPARRARDFLLAR